MGSGLGLAIVRAIVQLAHGRLGVTSSKHGSTFWLEFRYPIALASEVLALQEPPTPMSIAPASIKPHRPPIKPYKDGESSYSQWSASRFEANSIAAGYPVTPSTVDRESHFASDTGLTPQSSAAAGTSAVPRSFSGGESSRHPSISSGMGVPAGRTTSMDVHSPLTSEQWTSSNVLERSVLPAMSVTSATPTNSSSTIPQVPGSRPSPSPPLADRRASSGTDLLFRERSDNGNLAIIPAALFGRRATARKTEGACRG